MGHVVRSRLAYRPFIKTKNIIQKPLLIPPLFSAGCGDGVHMSQNSGGSCESSFKGSYHSGYSCFFSLAGWVDEAANVSSTTPSPSHSPSETKSTNWADFMDVELPGICSTGWPSVSSSTGWGDGARSSWTVGAGLPAAATTFWESLGGLGSLAGGDASSLGAWGLEPSLSSSSPNSFSRAWITLSWATGILGNHRQSGCCRA